MCACGHRDFEIGAFVPIWTRPDGAGCSNSALCNRGQVAEVVRRYHGRMAATITAGSWATSVPITLGVHCTHCDAALELSCQGLGGTVIYETYNEYLCPSCGTQNHARTSGRIVDVRLKVA